MNVAPKKVKNDILNKPQVIPAKSNSGLGIDANSKIIKKGDILSNL